MSKYTPGPWYARLGPFNYTNSGQRPIMSGPDDDLNAKQIALVSTQAERKRSTRYDAPDEERDANARLLAAAPDLLDALRRVMAEADFGDETLADQCHAAIAKAERK
jgi:hypothetical protein